MRAHITVDNGNVLNQTIKAIFDIFVETKLVFRGSELSTLSESVMLLSSYMTCVQNKNNDRRKNALMMKL